MAHLQDPQLKSQPFFAKTSRALRAPASIALRARFSLMLLQMQMIMRIICNWLGKESIANANELHKDLRVQSSLFCEDARVCFELFRS